MPTDDGPNNKDNKNNDGSNDDGSSGNGPTGTGSSVADLTKGMKDLKDKGPADVKLSHDARDKYVTIIGNFRNALQDEHKKMQSMPDLQDPGSFASAQQTRRNLLSNVTGFDGAEPTIKKYIDYLDAFEETVKKAADRLLDNG
jgi:hypothetical protein